RRSRPNRGRDKPTATEAAKPVAVLEALTGAARALRKNQNQLVALEQAARVVGMADGLACAAQEPAHHRHAHELARHEGADVARMRVLGEDSGLDHGAVP